jgi:hypothetical protein
MSDLADLENTSGRKYGRFRQFAHRKKRFLFGSVIAALFLYGAVRIWFVWVMLGILIALVGAFGHGCQAMLDELKELH